MRGIGPCYEERMVKLKETKVRATVKLTALWDAKTHIFHGVKWAKETGYFKKRFSEEHALGMVITKYRDEVTSRTTDMAASDLLSKLFLHNLHAFLYRQAPERHQGCKK